MAYFELLKLGGTPVMVGAPEKPTSIPVFNLTMGRKWLAGSAIGGIRETQEMLGFFADHRIAPEVEVIPIRHVNAATNACSRAT